jgi:hypothetical protein
MSRGCVFACVVLCALCGGLFCGLLSAPADAAKIGTVTVASDPSGYDAWIENRYVGRTPLITQVDAGPNLLVLARSSVDSIYSPPAADTLLHIQESETLRVFLRLGRPVTILSHPFGLQVKGEGGPLGRTPLLLRITPEQAGSLALVTPLGPIPIPGDSLLASGSWTWEGEGVSSPSHKDGRSLLMRLGRYALPGVAVVAVGAGAISEKRADRAYDRYLGSTDLTEIRRNFNDARTWDDWSTVLWTVGEVSLAASIVAWIIPGYEKNADDRAPRAFETVPRGSPEGASR